MKVVLIHGQNHHGTSCHMGRLLADSISSPEEQTEYFLPKDLNHFCTGCCRCLKAAEFCPFYSDKKRILDDMEAAEILIFTTPTYCMHASAPMKSFLDLTFTNWMVHSLWNPCFIRKPLFFPLLPELAPKQPSRISEQL